MDKPHRPFSNGPVYTLPVGCSKAEAVRSSAAILYLRYPATNSIPNPSRNEMIPRPREDYRGLRNANSIKTQDWQESVYLQLHQD